MELSETLLAQRPRLRLMLLALLAGVVTVFVAMLLQVGAYVGDVFTWLEGEGGLDLFDAMVGLLYAFFFVISLALGVAVVLFTGMMRRYFALMRARYGTLAGTGRDRGAQRRRGPREADLEEEAGRVRDPAMALLGMAREAEEEFPQLDEMLKYSTVFAMLLAMMSLTAGGSTVLGFSLVPEELFEVLAVVHVLGTVILSCGVLLQVEAQRFISHFIARVRALEAFESEGPVPVPEGEGALDRLAACVLARHGTGPREDGPVELEGASGQARPFDMVMGGPGERVLVRAFDGVPAIDEVRDLRTAAEDVARREGRLPLMVVALVRGDLDDLDVDDVVYDFLMEHPILDRRGERARSLQIVAEVEGHYSVLPFTVP